MLIIPTLLTIILQTSCNREEQIPVHLNIDKINLNVTNALHGSASEKITDAWIYIDGDLAGAYELPCNIPILSEGNHEITIKAGIKVNGIAASRAYYPFYTSYVVNITLSPDSIYEFEPVITYYDDKIQFNEDFEDGGISFTKTGTSDTSIVKTSESSQVFEGNYSGIINLNSTYDYALISMIDMLELPTTGKPVFLELNYKTNIPFNIGLYCIYSSQIAKRTHLIINPNDTWNKIYVNLTSLVVKYPDALGFKLFFEAINDVENDIENAEIMIDNIKILYTP